MKTAICPKCFTQMTEDQWVYACRRAGCKMAGTAIEAAKAARGRGGGPACPGCGEPFAVPLCQECSFAICEEDAYAASLAVSLVGAAGCGKSHFLSVLIDCLRHQVAKAYGCSLFPLGGDATVELYDDTYYQPLYVRGQYLEPTKREHLDPLIYSLVFQEERTPGAIDLIFYDSFGAGFESTETMASLNRSLYHSGGIIFMIEPTQLPSVAEWQTARKGKVCESDPAAMLTRIIQLIRTGSGQKNLRQKLDIPIAVCLTKLDMIKPLLDAASFLRAPSRHLMEARFDPLDFEACSLEVQSFMENCGGGEIIRQVTSQFSNYGFFAFSALGGNLAEGGGVHRVSPHRVTDPLLWLLWKNNSVK